MALILVQWAANRPSSKLAAGLADAAVIAIGFGLLSWVLVMVPWGRPGCTRRWPGCPSRPGGGRPGWAGAGCWPWGRPPWSPRPCWAVQRLRGTEVDVAAIAGAWALLFVLVMTRIVGLVRGIERAEADRRRVLDRTVQAAEQERTSIATELHDGPIQRPPRSRGCGS